MVQNMREFILTILVLTLTSTNAYSSDYSVSGYGIQEVPAGKVNEILLSCYCTGKIEVKRTSSGLVKLEVYATTSSVG